MDDVQALLLDHNVNSIDNNGDTPLLIAVKKSIVSVIIYIHNTKKKLYFYYQNSVMIKIFWIDSFKENYEMAKLLLENGADVNFKDEDRAAPLHYSIDQGLKDQTSQKWNCIKLWCFSCR